MIKYLLSDIANGKEYNYIVIKFLFTPTLNEIIIIETSHFNKFTKKLLLKL